MSTEEIDYATAIKRMADEGGALHRYRGMPECIVTMAMTTVEYFPRAKSTDQFRAFAGRGQPVHINALRDVAGRMVREFNLPSEDHEEVFKALEALDLIAATCAAFKALREAHAEFSRLTEEASPRDRAALARWAAEPA